jgi:hypothetical protein
MRLFAICLIALLCALNSAAYAQSKATAEKVGRIDTGHATSSCIGSANSPTCATETLLACFARVQPDLCAKVGVDAKASEKDPGTIEYIIDRTSVIRAEDITEELRDVEWFKAGYMLVELRRRNCPATCGGDESWEDMQVYLRPHGTAWDVVSWRGETEQEGAPEEPENFKATGKPQ